MKGWKEIKLGSVIKTNLRSVSKDLHYSKIMYLDTGSITRNKTESYQEFDLINAPSRAKRLVQNNDIVYSTVRPNQLHYGFIKDPIENLVVSTGFVTITSDKTKIAPLFLYYNLTQEQTTEYLHSVAEASTSAYPSLKPSDIESLDILLPPLPEQTAIADVLSSLDDKIDLLHRQNKTLEQMAETLFRQWFVEEAKEEWEEGSLNQLVLVKYGKEHKKLKDGIFPVFGSGGIMRFAESFLYDKESVLIPRKGTLNNVMYQDEPFWTVDTMFFTEMRKPNVAKFVYHFLKNQDLASMNVGSAVPSMTTEILNNMLLPIPPDEVFKKFEEGVAPSFKKIKSNQNQIRTLTQLRDNMLPKLMSGEVRVKM